MRQHRHSRHDRIRINPHSRVVEIDGFPAFRWISERNVLQFLDHNSRRSEARGTRTVEVELPQLIQRLAEGE